MSDTPAQNPDSRPPSGRWFFRTGLIIAGFVLLYYVVTGGIRMYVSSQIDKSAGQPMPDFELTDLTGRKWTAADLRGRMTVLNFFRSRCSNCILERDVIHQLATELDPKRARVVGIMMDRVVSGITEEMTSRTLQRFAYRHPILMADEAFVDAFHGAGWAHVTPVTYIVDANGRIVRALRGHQNLETLRAAVR